MEVTLRGAEIDKNIPAHLNYRVPTHDTGKALMAKVKPLL